ncbi:MAG: hypothetical protein CVV44_00250 [Spirochaetae bacterium HGW-Spirochaetae-1]|nr:MAG: hypothetical protein CVV44_00250 [Spirochaetae bacterium HGW-Spirochaetae-1]
MGRKAGITKDEYLSLIKLDKKDFPFREWVALVYAREWTFERGNDPHGEYGEEFARHFSKKERARIKKLLRMMLFANYCGNGFFKVPWRGQNEPQVCDISREQPGKESSDEE